MRADKTSDLAVRHASVGQAWNTVLGILLSFILLELLTQFLKIEYGSVYELWLHLHIFKSENWIRLAQFVVLLLLTLRFFSGAYRFHNEAAVLDSHKASKDKTFGSVFSILMSFLMFSLFFLGAREVFSSDKYYFIVFLIHAVDLVWFIVIYFYMTRVLKLNIYSSAVYPVVAFMAFTVVTILFFVGLVVSSNVDIFELAESDETAKIVVLTFLALISFFDLWWMYGFYARPRRFHKYFSQFDIKKIYLAGPDVFLSDQQQIGQNKCEICEKHGLEGVFPIDGTPSKGDTPKEIAFYISAKNEATMSECDAAIANMTPFRGPSMDVGTAYEIGFMSALEKPVFGYSNSSEDYFTRVKGFSTEGLVERDGDEGFEDNNGLLVENFDLNDNLMIDGSLQKWSPEIQTYNADAENRYRDLSAFEECVKQVASNYSSVNAAIPFSQFFKRPY